MQWLLVYKQLKLTAISPLPPGNMQSMKKQKTFFKNTFGAGRVKTGSGENKGPTEAQETPYWKESTDISWIPSKTENPEHLESYDGSPLEKSGMSASEDMHWSSTYGSRERRFKLSWDKNTLAFH